jgi:LPXTG-motif cell wall-anchored protein
MKRVVTFLLAAGLVFAVAAPATAAPPSSDPRTDARDAAAWIAARVNASGFIPSSTSPTKADLSSSAQAVTALAAAGVGKSKVTALLAYLGSHIDAFVTANGFDDPGAIAYLILAAKAGGADPTSFGPAHADLVTRLVATQQPDGLFGLAANATFTGAFDQGLSLLALHAAAIANPHGVTWLEGQQCADGSFTAFRADTTIACPAVNTTTFAGPDTNSTALALLGLIAQGDTTAAAKAEAALRAVRNSGGGWGFFARNDQPTDANSTGLVLEALRTVSGVADQQGIRALLALQVGCAGAVADRGGIAFQPDGMGRLAGDMFATVQATAALAEVALPITSATISDNVPTPCASTSITTVSTTSTTVAVAGSTVASAGSTVQTSTTTVATATRAQLPRTGTSSTPIAIVALCLLASGTLFVGGARRRRT